MLTLVPAYGRDYKSAKEARAAWFADTDWRICTYPGSPDDGRYINRPQAKPGERFMLRFKRLTQICVVGTEPPKPPTPRRKLPPAPPCAERFCYTRTRNRSGYCTRHNSPTWRAIRASRPTTPEEEK